MFTPKEIENALDTLFEMFDAEVMEMINENFGEEMDDISPAVLAKVFKEKADIVYEYRALCSVGDCMDYHGKELFKQRAVNLLTYVENSLEDERLHMVYGTELWLLEDMSFAVVHYHGTLVKNHDEPSCITEYRSFVSTIEDESDIFFTPEDLICELEDTCMFALLTQDAIIYEP